jgi:hypothetical protein
MSAVKPASRTALIGSATAWDEFTIGRRRCRCWHRILTQSGGTTAVDIETYGLGADACRSSASPSPMRVRP